MVARLAIISAVGMALSMWACALAGCGGSDRAAADDGHGPRQLAIAGAASVKPVLEAAAREFEAAHPDIEVALSFGSSGALYGQLSNGAPFDIFYSADTGYPRALAEAGLVLAGSERVYARGRLALWARTGSGIDPHAGLVALADPSVKHVAIANPELAPYGRAAVTALQHAGVHDAIAAKIVMGENTAQAAHFALSGAADAAVIPVSLVLLPAMVEAGDYSDVAADLHEPIEHAVVITASADDPELARAFDAFLAGPAGLKILTSHGFAGGQ